MKNKKIKFGIIGYGRFGKLWAKYISKFGNVIFYDNKNKIQEKEPGIVAETLEQVCSSDIVFLTVPISELENCCKTIKPFLSSHTLVVDVCSVKTWPVKIMKKYLPKGQPILATHPLFGPDSEKIRNGIDGLKIVVCPLIKENDLEKILMDIFKKLKLNIIVSSPSEHDKQMANSQALVHLIGRGLAKLKLNHQEISTPDYDSLVRIDQMVNNDTWQLFFDMQGKNPFAGKIRQKLIGNLEVLSEAIMLKDNTINEFRDSIRKTDKNIIRLLSFRFKLAKNIGILKQKTGLKVLDRNQEKKLRNVHRKYSEKNIVDQKFTKKIFNLIIEHSKELQRNID